MKRVQHLGPTPKATIKRFLMKPEKPKLHSFQQFATQEKIIGGVGKYCFYLCHKDEN